MNFANDFTARHGAPEILEALVSDNGGFALGYGNDEASLTAVRESRSTRVLERDRAEHSRQVSGADRHLLQLRKNGAGPSERRPGARVLLSCRGAFASLTSSAMRRAKTVGCRPQACRHAEAWAARSHPRRSPTPLSHYEGHAPHQVIPAAFSFAQASEAGTIYRARRDRGARQVAHAHGMKVHIDGARFANALVRMRCEPGGDRPGSAGV